MYSWVVILTVWLARSSMTGNTFKLCTSQTVYLLAVVVGLWILLIYVLVVVLVHWVPDARWLATSLLKGHRWTGMTVLGSDCCQSVPWRTAHHSSVSSSSSVPQRLLLQRCHGDEVVAGTWQLPRASSVSQTAGIVSQSHIHRVRGDCARVSPTTHRNNCSWVTRRTYYRSPLRALTSERRCYSHQLPPSPSRISCSNSASILSS